MLCRVCIILCVLFGVNYALASSTRVMDADSIRSSDHTKSYALPNASDTIVGRGSTDTLSNKTISGASNSLSQLPVGADLVAETPSGDVNGSNTSFTLSFSPPVNTAVRIYLDGMLLIRTIDYNLSGTAITMLTAPALGQSIYAIYPKY